MVNHIDFTHIIMNHKIARENIDIISALLKEWAKRGKISELDYDLLTDKIKCLYEMVKFAEPDTPADSKPIINEEDRHIVDTLYGRISDCSKGSNSLHLNNTDHKTVLGDVIRPCGATIADRFSGNKDIGTSLGSEKINSLRSAIGLNDKYLIVRDLFGGNINAYDAAIMQLDEFTTIEDALLFIHDSFGWSSENTAARMISDLLVRKLM